VPITRQCELLSVSRSSVYYQRVPLPARDAELLLAIDKIHTDRPFLGSRRIVDELADAGVRVNRKAVRRLMRLSGIEAIYQRPRTSRAGVGAGHRVFPYLLADVPIRRPNQVWAADITFIPMPAGFAYLVAILDVFSRRVLAWRLSNTMERRGAARGPRAARRTRSLQHRSGQPVHQPGLHQRAGGARGGDQHGRAGALDR
jgi:putative transposase